MCRCMLSCVTLFKGCRVVEHRFEPLAEILESLYNPGLARINMRLERVERLLALMGNPQLHLPPVVHVAGTNGKGSTIAFIKSIVEAAGYSVHVYTSPHLVTFNERIVIAGKMIEDEALLTYLLRVKDATQTVPATYFEATTAAAFLAFAEHEADIVLLETGMGGRLDATNVIKQPALTCITPVSLDHTEFLGSTLAAVAAEKAGILKAGVPCVVGPQKPEALEVITHKAAGINAPLLCYGQAWDETLLSGRMPQLRGGHQQINAATAMACVQQLTHLSVSEAVISEGIRSAHWPARLQSLHGRLLDILPEGSALWLDGGHNPAAAEAIAETIADWTREQSALPLYLICGMMARKDHVGYLQPLAPYIEQMIAIPIAQEPDSATPEVLVQSAEQAGIRAMAGSTIEQALEKVAEKGAPCRVLIGGSLYLAGKLLQYHHN